MKLGFLTLNTTSTKGGSEKLWRDLAEKTCQQGHDVFVSVYNSQITATRNLFKNSNLKIYSRPSFTGATLKKKITGGIHEKLFGWRHNHFFQVSDPDAYIISCGGLAELGVKRNQIQIANVKKPYVIIIQNNTENWVFEKHNMNTVSGILQRAAQVFFVSQRLQEQAERQVGMTFKNASLVANPIKKANATKLPISDVVNTAFIGTSDLRVKGLGLLIQAMSHKIWHDRKMGY